MQDGQRVYIVIRMSTWTARIEERITEATTMTENVFASLALAENRVRQIERRGV